MMETSSIVWAAPSDGAAWHKQSWWFESTLRRFGFSGTSSLWLHSAPMRDNLLRRTGTLCSDVQLEKTKEIGADILVGTTHEEVWKESS